GLPIRVLGTVAGRQHDGVALVVPTGESGRAGPTFTGAGNVQQVTGSTDQIVSSVCLDLGNPSLHDDVVCAVLLLELLEDRKSTRLNFSHVSISYAVFCLDNN